MTKEQLNATIARLTTENDRQRANLLNIKKRATVLEYEEDNIDQLKLNLSKILFWAEIALKTGKSK